MNMKKIMMAISVLAFMGCGSGRDGVTGAAQTGGDVDAVQTVAPAGGRPAAYMPRAVIYRTNGDYNNNVTITLNAAGTAPVSYPGPGDVGVQSEPVVLDGGWLLDRRGGIGVQTHFLTYTYSQYHALPAPPAVETLMDSIIPAARVTEAYRLPLPAANVDTAAVNRLIRSGLKDCTPLL